jgi:hypothetical protein
MLPRRAVIDADFLRERFTTFVGEYADHRGLQNVGFTAVDSEPAKQTYWDSRALACWTPISAARPAQGPP